LASVGLVSILYLLQKDTSILNKPVLRTSSVGATGTLTDALWAEKHFN
jgi:hypothetical protein